VKDFQYVLAKDLTDALERGSAAHSRFVAGGTLLVDLLRLEVERPETVIDLDGVLSSAISWDARGLTVGAAVRNTELAYDSRVLAEMPVLSEALLSGASPQLRNMASVAGNLLQRTRCAYFRDVGVAACNKRQPGSGCAAREGYSRMHALLGVSDQCIAAHPSDMCVALSVFDAEVRTRRRSGQRELPLDDLHRLPGEHPELETALEPGEIVTEVFVPQAPFARRSAYVKSRDRAAYAFALASAAAALELDGQQIKSVRVALGGVASKPWRAREVEAALIGKPATRESFEAAARLCMNGARTTADNHFKLELAPRVVVAALSAAGSKA
jgi:xanthine dehydrogenase YagS FAD-binding subunit